MIELIKTLFEKPEKFISNTIFFLKILLSILITFNLYEYLYGVSEPILFGDVNFQKDMFYFIFSGRVLIVIGLFLFVEYILFDLIPILFLALLNRFFQLFKLTSDTKDTNEALTFLYRYGGILKFNKNANVFPKPGRNFDIALKFAKEGKRSLNIGIKEIKETTFFEVFNLYFVFVLVYHFVLKEFHLTFITIFLIIGFIILFIQLLILEVFSNFIEIAYDDFTEVIKLVDKVEMVNTFFKENNILPIQKYKKGWKLYGYEFSIDDSVYSIIFYENNYRMIRKLKRIILENKEKQILCIVDDKIENLLLNNFDRKEYSYTTIRLKNEEQFKEEMNAFLMSKLN